MGLFSNYIGREVAQFTENTDSATPVTSEQGPKNNKFQRVSRATLEADFLTDAQTFGTVTKSIQLLGGAGYSFQTTNVRNIKPYKEFFDGMGVTSQGTKLGNLREAIWQDKHVYGYAYVEKVFNSEGTRIVDLRMVDPKIIDYARNNEGQIVLDEKAQPVGYVMKLGYGSKAQVDIFPRGVARNAGDVFLKRERIAIFKYCAFGNRYESIGYVEVSHRSIERRAKIEEAISNSLYIAGSFPMYATVGDNLRPATPQLKKATLEALQHLKNASFGVFSHPTKLDTLNVQHSPEYNNLLNYLRTDSSAASGMPLGISVGSGEIPRSTLKIQNQVLEVSLQDILRDTDEEFNNQIMEDLVRFNGYPEGVTVVSGKVNTEDPDTSVKAILEAVRDGVLAPEEVRKYIIDSYDLLENPLAFKKHKEGQVKKAKITTKAKEKIVEEDDNSEEESVTN